MTFQRLFFTGLAAVAFAQPMAATSPADRDLVTKVRTAIAADPLTRGANPIVSVVNGAAVVGGPVPSAEVLARVERIVRGVPGVAHVEFSCFVPAYDDPFGRIVHGRMNPQPIAATKAQGPKLTVAQRYAPLLPLLSEPALLGPPAERAGYSPVPPPAPPAPAGPPQYPTIAPPRLPVAPKQDVASAAEAVRRAESRYAGLTVRVTTGTVVIAGRADAAGDLWDLVAAVRKVPGVDKVEIGDVMFR